MGYYFVAESSQGLESHTCQFFRFFCHVFRTTVWWDPDTLLSSWTRDVTTCPLYKGLCQLKQIFFHVWIFQTNVIQGALICLRDASFNVTDLYSLALFAYTFTLAKDPTATSLFKALQSKAVVEGQCGPYNESYLCCRSAHLEWQIEWHFDFWVNKWHISNSYQALSTYVTDSGSWKINPKLFELVAC